MLYRIHRPTWLRGEGGFYSMLLRPKDGKKCCLGFVCEQRGISLERLHGTGDPESLALLTGNQEPELSDMLTFDENGHLRNASFIEDMMETNDSPHLTDEEREEALKLLAQEHGWELEFYD